MEGSSNYSNSNIVVANQRKPFEGIKIENPFSFKVLQVFTGFGFGCGIGIGHGFPINMAALPMVGEVMNSARGATNAFSGATRHVNNALKKIGAKNIEVGIGCGVGFGHGFGVGLAIKPGVVQKIQACLMETMLNMMAKLGIAPNLSIDQGVIPISLQSGTHMMNEPSIQNPLGSISQLATKFPDQTPQGLHGGRNTGLHSTPENFTSNNYPADTSFGTRTERVINSFLQNPILNEDDMNRNEVAGRLQSENAMLQLLLKHQHVIEELMKENEKLRQILVEDLKVPLDKLQTSYSSRNMSPCTDCFECRRKRRKW